MSYFFTSNAVFFSCVFQKFILSPMARSACFLFSYLSHGCILGDIHTSFHCSLGKFTVKTAPLPGWLMT